MEKKTQMRYFLLSFAAGFLALSVTAMLVVLYLPPQKSQRFSETVPKAGSSYLPIESDRRNLLLTVNTGSKGSLLFLIGFDPMAGKIPVAVIPGSLVVERGGSGSQSLTIGRILESSGVLQACNRLSSMLNVPIHATATLTREAAVELLDTLGGISFYTEHPITLGNDGVVTIPQGTARLSGAAVVSVLGEGSFSGGENERLSVATKLMASLINEQLPVLCSSEGESVVKGFCNLANTAISIDSYTRMRPAAQFVSTLRPEAAVMVELPGRELGAEFLLTDQAQKNIEENFLPPVGKS